MSGDSKERFTSRASDYSRYRPGYAREIVAAILDGFSQPAVADLGAGTGISARILHDAGATVFAIEPNAAMRQAIAPGDGIVAIEASAESTTLPDASVDVVTAFQAYHWFDAQAVLREARRIVRAHGRFAAVWNHRDGESAFTAAFESIVDRYDESGGSMARRRSSGTVVEDLRQDGWRNVRRVTASHSQTLDWSSVIGFARSASYLPKDGPAYESMEQEMRALYDRWPGEVAFAYVTEAYLAEAPLVE